MRAVPPPSGPQVGLVSLVEQLPDCAILIDSDRRIVQVNSTFVANTGYDREEILGQSPSILVAEPGDEDLSQALHRCLSHSEVFRGVFVNRTKSGDSYFAETTISPIRDADGQITHAMFLNRNFLDMAYGGPALDVMLKNTPLAMYVMQDNCFRYANGRFQEQSGYSLEELLNRPWHNLVPEEDWSVVGEAAAAMSRGERRAPFEYRSISRDGEVRWYLGTVTRVDFDGKPGSLGTRIDITDQKLAEQRLREANSLYAATIESTGDGIIVVQSAERRIVSFNQQFIRMWRLPKTIQPGMSVDEPMPYILTQLQRPDDFLARTRAATAELNSEVIDTLDLIDGRVFEVHSKAQWVEGKPAGRVWSFRDITERKQFESRLVHVASHDSLTGLLNRSRFQEEVSSWCRMAAAEGRTGMLVLLDIDRFKDVNDSLGHRSGDEIIVQVGRVLSNVARDHLVGRFGGDEFVLFIKDVAPEDARGFADDIRATIAGRLFWAGGVEMTVTSSAGIALFPSNGETVSQLLSRADVALYEAKNGGRNRSTVYTTQLDARSQIRLRRNWQNAVRDALEHEKLVLYAQPVLDLGLGKVNGHELLLRMKRDNGKVVRAAEFIGIAEQTGLVREIDRWVIREAASILQSLREVGSSDRMGINLSGLSFNDDSIVPYLREQFERFGVNIHGLVIELTETIALTNMERAAGTIHLLQELGCQVILDDFGAGFSSFQQLRSLPLDALKIDGSFIRNVTTHQRDADIVGSIVELAHVLGMRTIAEEVTDQQMLEKVRALGVDLAQGYLIGRPKPVSQLIEAVSQRQAAA